MAQKILPPAKSGPNDPVTPEPFTLDAPLPPELAFDPIPRAPGSKAKFDAARQQQFIGALAACGSATTAAQAVRMSLTYLYHLRNSAGAESFAAAWDRAVERGARRVLDVLVDHAINGTPEFIYKDGAIVAERRHFNTRAQMWIVAHYLPERFGVAGGLMHSASGPVGLKRLMEAWFREWSIEHAPPVREDPNGGELRERLEALIWEHDPRLRYVHNPDQRAAYELLHGPQDWTECEMRG